MFELEAIFELDEFQSLVKNGSPVAWLQIVLKTNWRNPTGIP